MAPKAKKARSVSRGKRRQASPELKEPTPPPTPPPEPYYGPRPDEGLLHATQMEMVHGDDANIERIYELMREGEDVNQCHAAHFTPLAVSSAAGNSPLVSLLLEYRADATAASSHRADLPLHHAAHYGRRVVSELLAVPTKAAGMLDASNNSGWSALNLASAGGHLEVVRLLLRHKASPNVVNPIHCRQSALHLAAQGGHFASLEMLLDWDADVDAIDTEGRAPLHFASACPSDKCVSLLLRSKADPMRAGPQGRLPLDLVPRPRSGDGERVAITLQAYCRDAPGPRRTDLRFDLEEQL